MTGYELMKQIKETYDLQGIAMSGYGMEEGSTSGEASRLDSAITSSSL